MSLRSGLAASLLALSPSFALNANAEPPLVLRPIIDGQIFEINCEKDLPNGHPSLEFVQRLEAIIHPGDENTRHFGIYGVDTRAVVDNFLRAHPKEREQLIKPAALKCGYG